MSDMQLMDRRVYTWCPKCRSGSGLWVSNHNAATHVNNYRSQRQQLEHQHKRASLGAAVPGNNAQDKQMTEDLPTNGMPTQLHGQLSLLDYLDSYLPDTDTTSVETDHTDID
jgi:hypothetical protein